MYIESMLLFLVLVWNRPAAGLVQQDGDLINSVARQYEQGTNVGGQIPAIR